MLSLCCLRPPRDAAALACVCANAAAAYRGGRWPRAVRVKRSGAILEPASGAFDVTVAPGEGVQAAVDRCPRGGCVLLLPGTHEGPLVLAADQEVYLFGRGLAALRAAVGDVLTSWSATAMLVRLIVRQEGVLGGGGIDGCGVHIRGGALRLEACSICSLSSSCVLVSNAQPTLIGCTCVSPQCRCIFSWPRAVLHSTFSYLACHAS